MPLRLHHRAVGRAASAWILLVGTVAAQEGEETRERWQRVPDVFAAR